MLSIGAIIMITGLSFFQIGAQNSLIQVGEYMGSSLSKQKKLFIVIIFAFLLGALVTCAEPSILIMSKQAGINSFLLIGLIAAGVGVFVVVGILMILYCRLDFFNGGSINPISVFPLTKSGRCKPYKVALKPVAVGTP